ncbi:MAG: (2Fe-2S)-binding protein [Candidatus Latescibacteria bacterium]|nr:(2Fe-2S)-binding protein [Candidatus Latescibacterota bacterium]
MVRDKKREGPRRLTDRPESLTFTINGREVTAYEGETVGAVLAAMGQRALRSSEKFNDPRGLFCGMGVCQECRVTVDGISNVRACMTLVTPGLRVELPGVALKAT